MSRWPRRRQTLGATTAQGESFASQLPAIGTAIGGPIGGAVGSTIDAIATLAGGHPHYTPGGVEEKTATYSLQDNQAAILNLQNQIAEAQGGAPQPIPTPPQGGTAASFQFQAAILNSYGENVPATQAGIAAAKENGTYDRVLDEQQAEAASLEQELADVGSGQGGGVTSLIGGSSQTEDGASGGLDLPTWLLIGGGVIAIIALVSGT